MVNSHHLHLPEEILIDIFSRLPAKLVGKCRCLAKPWRTLLSTPEFLKSHFTRKPHHEILILITPSHSTHSLNAAAAASTLINLPNTSEVAGSCHGLVLLVNVQDDKLVLVNPITLEQVTIPDSPLALIKEESFSMHGFGYDTSTNDYKVVTLSYYKTANDIDPDCEDTFMDVYSVKRGVWTRIGSSPYDHAVPYVSCGAFLNGAIHWLASSSEHGYPYPSVITAFDLADEVFDEIPAPSDLDVSKFVFNRLVVLWGCLCMFDDRSSSRSDIWIMKEYGVEDSWTKLTIDADCEWDIIKPLGCIGDDEIVLLTEGETLVVYNVKEGTLRDMVVDGVPAVYIDGGAFVESLVSPS